MQRVAYVTARFPPMMSSGTRRIEALRHNLPEFGYQPIFVTIPHEWVGGSRDPTPGGSDHVRIGGGYTAVRAIGSVPGIRRLQRHLMIPDMLALWARQVPKRVPDQVRDVDLVAATGPPFSANEAARRLADELGVPCVQEFRDPPSFRRLIRGRSASFRRRMHAFERKVMVSAAATIVVTPGMRRELLRLHPEFDPDAVKVVMNGYPEVDVDPSLSGRDPTAFTVAYVGSIVGDPGEEASPSAVLDALAQLDRRVELRLVGPLSEGQRRYFSQHPHRDLVNLVGQVDRRTALAELAAADVSLVLAHEDDHWWIGRKVFESLAYAQRILAVVPPGDTSDLLASADLAEVVRPGDLQTLESTLECLSSDDQQESRSRDLMVESDRGCARQVAEVFDRVLAGTSDR